MALARASILYLGEVMAQPHLDRSHIDAMLHAIDIVPFDGPPCTIVAGTRYATLTTLGVKTEGEAIGSVETTDEAWRGFLSELLQFVGGARQVAWRSNPELRGEPGKWLVLCRLAKF